MIRLKVAIDCDMSPRLTKAMTEIYGNRGFEFHHVSCLVTAGTEDEIWADAFKRFGGHVVLSGDKKIGSKPHKALAFIENGFASFFMDTPWSQMEGHAKAAHVVYWWPVIERAIRDDSKGKCFRVPCDMKQKRLSLVHSDLTPMVIPEGILEAVKARRESGK